jgi:hypothetical protein
MRSELWQRIRIQPFAQTIVHSEQETTASMFQVAEHTGGPRPAHPAAFQPGHTGERSRFDVAIYWCLLVFVASLAHSKALTEIAYGVAMLLWVSKMLIHREHPRPQPLVPALLAFLLFTTLSTALAPVPALSWERMKSVGLLIISVLFAQNVRSLRQARTLVILLILSTLLSVGYNAWLYTYGFGANVPQVPAGSFLSSAGFLPGDVITRFNGHRVHSPGALRKEIREAEPVQAVRLEIVRGELLPKFHIAVPNGAELTRELLQTPLTRGHPARAKGSLAAPVTYSEVLLQIALLTWGLLLAAALRASRPDASGAGARHRRYVWLLLIAFVLMCITLGGSGTRASLVSCGVASLIVLWLCVPSAKVRAISIVALAAAVLIGSIAVQRQRGLGMIAPEDAGTKYRVLMWEDGLRLVKQYPLFGIGMDSLKTRWREFNIRAYQLYPLRGHFHSTPIQLAVERGLLTLASWIYLMALYLRTLWGLQKRIPGDDWFIRGTGLGIMAATLGFLASSLVHYNLGDSEVQMLFWFLMGLALAVHHCLQEEPNQLKPPA